MDTQASLQVAPTDCTFNFWLNQPFVSDAARTRLANANVLITPLFGYLDYAETPFAESTVDFYHYLLAQDPEEFIVDICSDDDKFSLLALRDHTFDLPSFVVVSVVAPIFVQYVIRFIDNRFGSRASRIRTRSDVTITEDVRGGRTVKISYEGPADRYDEYMGSTLRQVNSAEDLDRLSETEGMGHEARIRRLSVKREV